MKPEDERQSKPLEVELITDPEQRARKEARNGLRQFDAVLQLIEEYTEPNRTFRLRPSIILHLHRVALDGISRYAGNYRPAGVRIVGSAHQPVEAHLVPHLVEELCDYVNQNWNRSPIHLAAYTLWRLNWIHPFADGNGRTSRALSYLVLCVKLGYLLPGTNTIPEQISSDKTPYYLALEAADIANAKDALELTVLENLLSGFLASQLVSVHRDATGGT